MSPNVADEFVDLGFRTERDGTSVPGNEEFHKEWFELGSAKFVAPELMGSRALRKLYPKHSLVMTNDWNLNLLGFPGVYSQPISASEQVTNVFFIPLARRFGGVPGILIDSLEYTAFQLGWEKYEFIMYSTKFTIGFGQYVQHFILHEGPEEPIRDLLLACGSFSEQVHNEIWVYNQGYWRKDNDLWVDVQKADWKDVILKSEFKQALQKDVYGFFKSEDIYKKLAIPWKRGLIMYGPPGNGKTISLKVIMKTCAEEGFNPLYVKSFQNWMGEEKAMADVFEKARLLAPCVVILEDLDSLINDGNRSFFLNQVDGIVGNDGLLIIGTTNHFDRLDPALSSRPSRFDRKYEFSDPDREERALYAKYWQAKLKSNESISFPNSLVDQIADATDEFSFAYLKEAFVSSLVLLAGYDEEGDKHEFASVLLNQIKVLRQQIGKKPSAVSSSKAASGTSAAMSEGAARRSEAEGRQARDVRVLLDALSNSVDRGELGGVRSHRLYSVHDPQADATSRDIHALLDALSESMSRGPSSENPSYHRPSASAASDSRSYRELLDSLSSHQQSQTHPDRIYHARPPTSGPAPISHAYTTPSVIGDGRPNRVYHTQPSAHAPDASHSQSANLARLTAAMNNFQMDDVKQNWE